MTQQLINLGTPDTGNGDPIRTAFDKVNQNFTELYTALGLDEIPLNLGSFEFTGNTITTTDSSSVIIDQSVVINSELTMKGDIVPNLAGEHNLGSLTHPWGSLYVSGSTIYIGGAALKIDNEGELTLNDNRIVQQNGQYIDLNSNVRDVNVSDPQPGDTLQWGPGYWINVPNGITTNILSEDDVSIKINLTDSTQRIWTFTEGGDLRFPDGTTQSTAFTGGGITASSSDTFTNKTINIQTGQNNTFQIQGNSISSYSGSGAVVLLQTMPTLNAFNIGNGSNLTVDGGTGSYYWSGPTGVAQAGIDKAGVYRSSSSATNSLFTFAANGAGTMSAAVEGSLFIGTALPSNNGGLNTNYSGWLVVQSGGKFGGDLNTRGALIFDDAATGAVVFADGTRQTTAWDTGYLSFDDAALRGTSGYTYTFNTDGYFSGSTSSESTSYFFVTYNSTNLNIAAGWTVVGANCDTTVSSTVYPVAGYPGVIRVNLTAAASATSGFYPVVVTSPDRLKVQIQPNPGTSDKYTFTTAGVTFPNNAQLSLGESAGGIFANQTTGKVSIADYMLGGSPAAPSKTLHIGGPDYVAQINGYAASNPPIWTFGNDRSLEIPGDIRSEGNINIDINLSDSTLRRWTFGEDGNTEFPGAITVPGTITGNILKIEDGVHEKFQTKADATGTVTHDCSAGHIFFHTSPDANWTANFTNLNLSSGYATTVTLVIEQGGTGYYPNAVQIGGNGVGILWQGNATPTPSTNRIDVVTFSILYDGLYTVLGQLTGF